MADTSLSADAPLVEVIAAVLADRGPMLEEQIVSVLSERGVPLDDDLEAALIDAFDKGDGLLTMLSDDRWASVPALLGGRVFTHRLTAPEAEHGFLVLEPDLTLVEALARRTRYQRLTDGSAIIPVFPELDDEALAERGLRPEMIADGGALLLPTGCLQNRGLSEGDVVSVRVTEDGLQLAAAPGEAVPADRLAALSRGLHDELAIVPGEPIDLHEALTMACANDPALFAEPLPPLSEALGACGLQHDDEWLASADFDFPRWRARGHGGAIARRHHLSDEAAFAVLAILEQYERVAALHEAASEAYDAGGEEALAAIGDAVGGEGVRDVVTGGFGAALPLLAEVPVAEALLAEIPPDSQAAAALGLFAESLEPMAPRPARPALRWLLGKAHERLGEVAKAEAAYEAAESMDPGWSPALYDLARFAGDRGDAARGLALLRRAGAPPDDALMELFTRFEAKPRTDVGRNDPCWCGSGRKYKKCHLNNETLTLDERAGWLYRKAALFLADGPWRIRMLEAAQARAEFSDRLFALVEALDDPLTADAVLFEGGAFAEFLAARGPLLPDDERLLAEQWLLVERSVFEVEQVRAGERLTLRDVRTGDIHQVIERRGSRQLTPGALICARVVPVGETEQIFGGIEPVALKDRDELIALLDSAPDPEILISFLSRRFAPVVPQNTEDEPLVLCEVTLRTGDPAALAAELDETYERDGDAWHEHVSGDGTERIRATVRLDGHDLTVSANSKALADRMLAVLRKLDPTLTVVNEFRQPAHEVAASAES